MKALIIVAIVALVFVAGRGLLRRYQDVERHTVQPGGGYATEEPKAPGPTVTVLEGMPPNLEAALEAAGKQGAAGLRNFLALHGRSIRDPRLADIELDYVVLLIRQDPVEARRVFNAIKARVLTSSPVYPRIKKLESTFQ
jgi:hypothetical protein